MTEKEPWSYHPDGSPVYALADIIRKRAAATPEAVALAEAGRVTSFAELDRRSSQVARALRATGVSPGDRVAYIGASGPEFAEVMYGAAKSRAIFTAVNNRLSAREVLAILADAEPRVVVTDPAAAALAAGVDGAGAGRAGLVTDGGYQSWRDAAPAEDPGEQAGPDETALLLYTSGTTGAPKGVELTGRNLGCALHELHTDIELGTQSVCAAPIPFFHIAGLGMLLAANLNGGNLLLEQAADMAGVLRLLVERKVTHAVLVPTVLQRLLALPEARATDWSTLRYVVYGASPIPLPVLKAATEVMGCKFLQSYGLTESTGGFTLLSPADHRPADHRPADHRPADHRPAGHVAAEEFERRLRSAGRPMAGSPVRVVDPVTLEDCAPGQRGEVIVSGSRVMKGYWRQPGPTAEVMLPGGWLRTGDGGSFDQDGYLYLHDRLKDMIVTGGENVYPAEVESVMTGHPAVAEVAVVGVPSDEWGESPWAVVVLSSGASVSGAELLAWTRDRLAHFKCPAGVTFVPSLARTASGKLQKQAIRTSLGEGLRAVR